MKTSTFAKLAAGAACIVVAGCIPPAPEPTPTAVPTPTPTPAPPPPEIALPVPENWMDAPPTPGDWTYRPGSGQTQAVYGPAHAQPYLVLTCNTASRQITLSRSGSAAGPVPMRILSETRNATLTAQPTGSGVPATIPAGDRLLDAMAFSKGRFAVETQGLSTLYIPAWPEVTRVIEDCR